MKVNKIRDANDALYIHSGLENLYTKLRIDVTFRFVVLPKLTLELKVWKLL